MTDITTLHQKFETKYIYIFPAMIWRRIHAQEFEFFETSERLNYMLVICSVKKFEFKILVLVVRYDNDLMATKSKGKTAIIFPPRFVNDFLTKIELAWLQVKIV